MYSSDKTQNVNTEAERKRVSESDKERGEDDAEQE